CATHAPLAAVGCVAAIVFILVLTDVASRARRMVVDDPTSRRIAAQIVAVAFIGLTVWGACAVPTDPARFAILVLAIGTGNGIFGMLAAHDLLHRRGADRALGLLSLTSMGYRHFAISHLHGHHRLAATERDPGTARRGESVYAFIVRTVWRQIRDTYRW